MQKNDKRNWLFCLKTIAVFTSLLISQSVTAQLSGTYTINSGLAKGGTNFQTFTELADTLTSDGVTGSVTVNVVVGSGPYLEWVEFSAATGASATSSIIINGNGERISYGGTATRSTVVALNGADFYTIDSLIIENTGTLYGRCVQLQNDADNNTIARCQLNMPSMNNTATRNAYVMISNDGPTSNNTLASAGGNNRILNNVTSGPVNFGPYYGILMLDQAGNTTTNPNIIDGNNIKNFSFFGIRTQNCDEGTTLINNEIHNTGATNNFVQYAIWALQSNTVAGFNISGNLIHDLRKSTNHSSYGIIYQAANTTGTAKSLISNNIIDVNGSGTQSYGIYVEMVGNAGGDILYNTVNVQTEGTLNATGFTICVIIQSAMIGEVGNNNVKSNANQTAGNLYAFYDNGTGTTTFSNNNIDVADAIATNNNIHHGFRAGTNLTSFSDLQTTMGTNWSNESVSFVDRPNLDYRPSSPGYANLGKFYPSVLTDIYGDTRSTTTPDIGAAEFALDLSVVSIDFMTNATECGGFTQAVGMTIKNEGSYDLTEIPVAYDINGVVVSELVTSIIAPGASLSYVFTEIPTFYTPGINTVKTYLPSIDDILTNNEANYSFTIQSTPTGGSLAEDVQFDGYFNSGTMLDPDVVVNTFVSNYEILPATQGPPSASGYSYSILASTAAGIDVTTSGFTLSSPTGSTVSMDPDLTLAGETIFLEVTAFDAGTGCDTSFGRYVYVPHAPIADFNASDICFGGIAQFENTTTLAGPSFIGARWNFNDPDASILGDTAITVDGFWEYSTFSIAPTDVELTVYNAAYPKFRYSITKQINIKPIPVVDFKVLNACEGIAISVLNTTRLPNDPATGMPVSGTVAYDWDFGGEFTSNAIVPSHIFSSSGQRQITLIASANGCNATLSKNAYQFERPEAGFSSEGACNFVPVSFINESTIENNGNMGYQWDFNGEGIGRADDPMFAFATAGTKTVTLTARSEFGCENTTTRTVVLEESPEADFSWETACNLTPVSFTQTGSSPLNGANSSYFWDFDGESTTTQKNPEHLFSNLGVRKVTLKIEDGNGCSNEITKDVNVVLQAVADFEAEGACSGDEVVFTNISEVAAGRLDYLWRFGDDNTSNNLNPTHVYSIAKDYDVTLFANVEGGCSDSLTKSVTVIESPNADFSIVKGGRTVSVAAVAVNNDIYNWSFGNGTRADNASATNTYENVDAGKFTICLATKKDECWSEKCEEVTINLAGIENLTQSNDMILVYPNPSQGQFTVAVDNASEVVVKVGDILGNVIAANVIDNLNGTYSVDMSAVADGVYFVQVKNGDFFATKRITISK